MITLDLAIALPIVRAGSHMTHTADTDEVLEVGDRTIVFVGDAVASHPLIECGFIDADQAKRLLVAGFGSVGPVIDEVDY